MSITSMNRSLAFALALGLVITLPAAAALIAMPLPVVDVLFRRGAFSAADTVLTAQVLAATAVGLPPVVLAKILAPAFFARGDTKTPMLIAIGSMILNVALAFALMRVLAAPGIALAASLAGWAAAAAMGFLLARRGHLPLDQRFRRRMPRLILSAGVMGLILYAGIQAFPDLTEGSLLIRIGFLAALVTGGSVLYFALAQISGGIDLREVKRRLARRRG